MTNTTATSAETPRSSGDHPPSYHPSNLPAYSPPASSGRFAKHDAALTDLYDRLAEEQEAVDSAQRAAEAYERECRARAWRGEAPPNLSNQDGKDPREKHGNANIFDRWVRWSAKFYAPNLYKDKK